MELKFDLLLFSRHLTKVYDQFMIPIRDKYGLNANEMVIISFLFNHPHLDTAKSICEIRMLSKGNVSAGIDSLVKKGYLKTKTDENDRRVIHLVLTKKAIEITDQIKIQKSKFSECLFQYCDEEELENYFDINEKLFKALQDHLERRNHKW